jgi:hypothetical protein
MGSSAAKQKDIVHRRIVYRKYEFPAFLQGDFHPALMFFSLNQYYLLIFNMLDKYFKKWLNLFG